MRIFDLIYFVIAMVFGVPVLLLGFIALIEILKDLWRNIKG